MRLHKKIESWIGDHVNIKRAARGSSMNAPSIFTSRFAAKIICDGQELTCTKYNTTPIDQYKDTHRNERVHRSHEEFFLSVRLIHILYLALSPDGSPTTQCHLLKNKAKRSLRAKQTAIYDTEANTPLFCIPHWFDRPKREGGRRSSDDGR